MGSDRPFFVFPSPCHIWLGQKENPLGTTGFSLCYLLPVGFLRYPFLSHTHITVVGRFVGESYNSYTYSLVLVGNRHPRSLVPQFKSLHSLLQTAGNLVLSRFAGQQLKNVAELARAVRTGGLSMRKQDLRGIYGRALHVYGLFAVSISYCL